jgi:hypothetical protein
MIAVSAGAMVLLGVGLVVFWRGMTCYSVRGAEIAGLGGIRR